MYSYGPPHMAVQKQDDQLELTYSNYVRTQDVTLKTCRRRWTIGRSGERVSGISVPAARHDDDADDVSSLSPDNLHLLFCCVLSLFALIWFVLMALYCAAIRRDSVSLLRFPFFHHVRVFSWEYYYYYYLIFNFIFCFL